MSPARKPKNPDRFQGAVNYLAEYSGVKGAAVFDSDGLVVSKNGNGSFDADLHAAMGLAIVKSLGSQLRGLSEQGVEFLTVKTRRDWVTVARSGFLFLVVAADRQANDLLNVRISRSIEMVAAHLGEKYRAIADVDNPEQGKSAKISEAVNV